jgi:hypothetical protein
VQNQPKVKSPLSKSQMLAARLLMLAAVVLFIVGIAINNRAVIFGGLGLFCLTVIAIGCVGWLKTHLPAYKTIVLGMTAILIGIIVVAFVAMKTTINPALPQALAAAGSLIYLVSAFFSRKLKKPKP